jgi:hypothetical protein
MVKVMGFFTRRPGMSREEFVSYYEDVHRLFGEGYLKQSGAIYYVRKYLNPLADWSGTTRNTGYDVVMEIWFKDEASFKTVFETAVDPNVLSAFEKEEAELFDRSRSCFAVVHERESQMTESAG